MLASETLPTLLVAMPHGASVWENSLALSSDEQHLPTTQQFRPLTFTQEIRTHRYTSNTHTRAFVQVGVNNETGVARRTPSCGGTLFPSPEGRTTGTAVGRTDLTGVGSTEKPDAKEGKPV